MKDMIGLFGVLAVLATLSVISLKQQDRALNVEDCVTEQWAEFEDRTGTMPSINLEMEWRKECIKALHADS